jgi:hypothetical protein
MIAGVVFVGLPRRWRRPEVVRGGIGWGNRRSPREHSVEYVAHVLRMWELNTAKIYGIALLHNLETLIMAFASIVKLFKGTRPGIPMH